MNRWRRALLIGVAIWLGLTLVSGYAALFAHVALGEEKPGWAQDLYCGSRWVQNLSDWLEAAYSEDEGLSGFGDLGPESLVRVNLYTTYGAVHTLHYLGEEVRTPRLIGNYINSLLNGQGAYDCPLNDAPPVVETYWAVSTLHLLGIPPRNPEKTIAFLLSLQSTNGLFRLNDELEGDISATWLAAKACRQLDGESIPSVKSSLSRAASGVREVVDSLLRRNLPALDAREADQLKSALELLALLDPKIVPEKGKTLLVQYLTEIPLVEVGFNGPSSINDLLDAAEAVGLIQESEVPSLPGLAAYLQRVVAQTEITKLGGYGWYCRWAGRVDPVMTWPCVRLFARAGFSYPSREKLIRVLDKYQKEAGWATIVIPCPSVDFTYFGLSIAQAINWENYNPVKMLAYARSILQDSKSDVHDLYWAAKLALELGENKEVLESALRNFVRRISQGDLEEEMYWIVLLMAEFRLRPPPHVFQMLQEAATLLTEALSSVVSMRYLRLLVYIQAILGQQWLPNESLEEMVWSLKDKEGGFKALSSAPTADLMSTWWALQVLAALGTVYELNEEEVLSFVRSCQTDFGYAWSPSGASKPDFYSTYVGITIIKTLRQLVRSNVSL